MTRSIRIATLAKTFLLEPITPPDGNAIQLRVDVFSWSDREFTCQVWRLDMYRIKPTFYDDYADEQVMVLDHGLDWDRLRADSVDALLGLLFDEFERRFGWKVTHP
jgi:hypothetical protein